MNRVRKSVGRGRTGSAPRSGSQTPDNGRTSSGPADDPDRCVSLLSDHALQLAIEPELLPLVIRWVPRQSSNARSHVPAIARIQVKSRAQGIPAPAAEPILALGSVRCWLDAERDVAHLHGAAAASIGHVEFATRRAALSADPASGEAPFDLYSMLTVSAALLLCELGRTLVHAAGVVSREGGAWLVVGDARAGKSTTCANLVSAGWGYLSDDQVVLVETPGGTVAEGWLRPFHVDAGWADGGITGQRTEIDPVALERGCWKRLAPVRGLLFPSVHPDERSDLRPLGPVDALAGLVRQTPWFLARRETASNVLALLHRTVQANAAYRLRLGLDTYRDGQRLSALVARRPPLTA